MKAKSPQVPELHPWGHRTVLHWRERCRKPEYSATYLVLPSPLWVHLSHLCHRLRQSKSSGRPHRFVTLKRICLSHTGEGQIAKEAGAWSLEGKKVKETISTTIWFMALVLSYGTLHPGLRTADVRDITRSGSDLLHAGDTRGYCNKSKSQIRARIKKDAQGQGLVLPRSPESLW